MTNVPWRVSAAEVAAAVGVADVRLLNDLEAMAHAVPVLAADELHTLQAGRPNPAGNAALIAAGTGLGEAILHRVGGRMLPVPSEAGHSDFAVRTDDEAAFWRFLRDRFGRVDIEHVLSGPGMVRLAEFTHGGGDVPDDWRLRGDQRRRRAGLGRGRTSARSAAGRWRCSSTPTAARPATWRCARSPRPGSTSAAASRRRSCRRSSRAPSCGRSSTSRRCTALLAAMPVHVILNEQAALVGAATAAAD